VKRVCNNLESFSEPLRFDWPVELWNWSWLNIRKYPRDLNITNYCSTVHDLKLSHFFQKKILRKSVTIWEHLPKKYHFWTIIKQKQKSVTIWGHGLITRLYRDQLIPLDRARLLWKLLWTWNYETES